MAYCRKDIMYMDNTKQTDIQTDAVYRLSPKYAMAKVREEYVISAVTDSVVNLNTALVLNHAGTMVVDGIKEGLTVADVVARVADYYRTDAAAVSDDILFFLRQLLQRGIIEASE